MRFETTGAFALFLSSVTASLIIHELNATTIDTFLTEHPKTLLSFVAPWCSACQDYKIELEAVAESTSLLEVALAIVDCDENKDVCQQFKVPVYPTVLMVDGDEFFRYHGKREQSAIRPLVERYARPLVSTISSTAALEEFKTVDRGTVIGYLNDEKARGVFRATADKYRDRCSFAVVSEEMYASAGLAHETAVLVHSSFNAREAWYNAPLNATSLEEFIIFESTPSLGHLGKDIDQNDPVFGKGLPIAVFLTADQEAQTLLSSTFTPLADETRGQVLWMTSDPEKLSGLMDKLNLDADKGPFFVITQHASELKFAYPVQGSVQGLIDSEEGIGKVIDELLAGKLVSSIPSEAHISSETIGESGRAGKSSAAGAAQSSSAQVPAHNEL